MADRAISDLTSAEQITISDLFLLEQGGTAKKLTGQVLIAFLTALADGHGGISGIQKTGTSGLVDTYRITLADGTYSDFTVTNGQKGDRGDNAYTWIKYASQEPTASSHSMGDLPDAWMGVYAGNAASAPTDWRQYKWFNIKGQKGDTGDPARIVSASVTYQVGTNATDAPSGQWLPVVPETPQGAYLWSRIEIQFNSGDPIIVHSVARMGVDGVGTVNSVNGVTPDPTGNITISATTVGALPRNGGTLQGPLNVNSHRITGLPTPTDDTDAVPYSMIKNVRELKWQNPDASANFFGQTITISDPGKQYTFATINFLAAKQGTQINQHMIMLDDIPLEDNYSEKRRAYSGSQYREFYISYVNGSWNFRFWGAKSADSTVETGAALIPVEIYLIKHIMPTVDAAALGENPDDNKVNVTAESIIEALGYTPANEEDVSAILDAIGTKETLVPGINLNDGVWEYGRFASDGTEYDKDSPIEGAFRNANYLKVDGGRSIAVWFAAAEWNNNNVGYPVEVVQYDADKNICVSRTDLLPHAATNSPVLTLNANTVYIRLDMNRSGTAITTPLSDIQIGVYYVEDFVHEYVPYEPTVVVETVLNVESLSALRGKKIVYDGDSICESRTSGTSANGGGYAKLIADHTKSTYVNQAVGGARLCVNSDRHSVVNNLGNLPMDGDLYCFEGGINDFWGNTPIGECSLTDYTGAVDDATICGALETIFRYALTNFVGKPVCFIITHKIQNTAYTANSNGDTFKDYRDAMIQVCQKYSIPYYDAFSESGLNGWNEAQKNAFTSSADGTHPNEAGYRRYYVPQLLNLFERILPVT